MTFLYEFQLKIKVNFDTYFDHILPSFLFARAIATQ